MTDLQPTTHISQRLHDKNLRILNRLKKALEGGEVRISQRGVPYYTYYHYSVVRFGNKKLRVFSPHPSKDQERTDFGQWPDVVRFLKENRP